MIDLHKFIGTKVKIDKKLVRGGLFAQLGAYYQLSIPQVSFDSISTMLGKPLKLRVAFESDFLTADCEFGRITVLLSRGGIIREIKEDY